MPYMLHLHASMSAGCTFANFGGGQAAAVLATHPAASASFTNCTFQSNTFFPPAPPANTLPGAPTAVEVPTTAVPPAAIRVTTNLAAVRLEQCLFRGNAQAGGHGNGTAAEDCADVAVADGVRVYADTQSSATWRARDGGGWQVGGMWIDGVNTQSLSAADTGDFLSAGDEWLQVQPEVCPADAVPAPLASCSGSKHACTQSSEAILNTIVSVLCRWTGPRTLRLRRQRGARQELPPRAYRTRPGHSPGQRWRSAAARSRCSRSSPLPP